MASGWGVVNELVVVKDKGALMDNYRGDGQQMVEGLMMSVAVPLGECTPSSFPTCVLHAAAHVLSSFSPVLLPVPFFVSLYMLPLPFSSCPAQLQGASPSFAAPLKVSLTGRLIQPRELQIPQAILPSASSCLLK